MMKMVEEQGKLRPAKRSFHMDQVSGKSRNKSRRRKTEEKEREDGEE